MTRLFEDPALDFGTESGITTPVGPTPADSSGLQLAVDSMGGSGIGVAPPAARDPYKDAYAGMSTGQEIFTRIGEFGAGVTGHPSPLGQQIETNRREKSLQLDELTKTVSALEHGISMIQGVEGAERNAFVDSYAKRLDGINPGTGDTFRALAQKPDLLTQFKDYAQYLPEPMQLMMKSNPKEFVKFAGTAEGMKALTEAKDRSDLRLATKKMQTAMLGLDKFVPAAEFEAAKKDGVITASELIGFQKYLPKEAQLSEAELQAVQRNDKVFWQGLGVLHGDKEQEMLAKRAEGFDKNRAPTTRTIREGNKEIQQEWKDGKWVEVGRGDHFKPEAVGPGGITKDVRDTELKISDDWRQDTKKFAERRPLFESTTSYMAERGKSKTSSGDAALMFAYAKMRDPNDRLAVSETRDLVKLGNIFERVGANVVGVLEKGETLPDRVANQMYDEIRRSFGEQNRAQTRLEKQYRDKIKAYGGEASRVMGEGLALPEEQLRPTGDRPIDPNRPVINNPDGSISTERTITIEADGRHYLIPTIVAGKQLTSQQAVAEWKAGRNNEVGAYNSAAEAETAAKARSKRIGDQRGGGFKDAAEVRSAFQAGRLSREQARTELKKFGF